MLNFFYLKCFYSLKKGKLSKGGRNFLGRVCVAGKGFLNKKKVFFIDFFKRINQKGIIYKYVYDYNRTGRVCLVYYVNGLISNMLLCEGLYLGAAVYSGDQFSKEKISEGSSLTLQFMPLFSLLNSVELKPHKGGIIARAGGASAVLIAKTKFDGILKLKSGWQLKVPLECMSTHGVVKPRFKWHDKIGKAGKHRNMGFRPKVRGVAKNPCDHAHGGGNGKRSKPTVPVNANVTCFKWKHTKNKKKERKYRREFKKLI